MLIRTSGSAHDAHLLSLVLARTKKQFAIFSRAVHHYHLRQELDRAGDVEDVGRKKGWRDQRD